MRSGDPPAAGMYEQSADWPSSESLYSASARFIDVEYSLTVMGCVDAPDTLRYSRLVDLATLRSDGTVVCRSAICSLLSAWTSARRFWLWLTTAVRSPSRSVTPSRSRVPN